MSFFIYPKDVRDMSDLFKWKLNQGDRYPFFNRLINSFFIGIIMCFLFWPLTLTFGFLSLLIGSYSSAGFRAWIVIAWLFGFAIIMIYVFAVDKFKT